MNLYQIPHKILNNAGGTPYPRVWHCMPSSATSKACTASSSGTVVPALRCRLICRASSVYGWKLRTFLIASPMESLTTPYSVTKRFATAEERRLKGVLDNLIILFAVADINVLEVFQLRRK